MNTRKTVTRVQSGVPLESRVLKALRADLERSAGDRREGMMRHAGEGRALFSAGALRQIRVLTRIYGLRLTAADAHTVRESDERP